MERKPKMLPDLERVDASTARADLSRLTSQVEFGKKPIVLTRRGMDAVVVCTIADFLELLELRTARAELVQARTEDARKAMKGSNG